MAEMTTALSNPHAEKGVKKLKKKNSRVDLTAMVDVCFLLIMFFIFTTQLESLNAMRLIMPKDIDEPIDGTKAPESGAFTVLLGKNNEVYYYEGILNTTSNGQLKKTSATGIRGFLQDKKKRTPEKDLVVIIKATDESTYKNTVDILDEMTINAISRYALVDISTQEKKLLAARN